MQAAIAQPFTEAKNAARMPLVSESRRQFSKVAIVFRQSAGLTDNMHLALDHLRVVNTLGISPREDENVFVRAQGTAIRAEKTNRHRFLPNQLVSEGARVCRDQFVRELP